MSSNDGAEPVEWGTSFGRLGSDSSDAPASEPSTRRSTPAGNGLTRSASSSFGRNGSSLGTKGSFSGTRKSGGSRATRGKRGARGSGRAQYDDPFGPVVGASADSVPLDDVPAAGSGRRRSPRERDADHEHPELRLDPGDGPDSVESVPQSPDSPSSGRPSAGERGSRAGSGGRSGGDRSGRRSRSGENESDGPEAPRSDEEWASLARSIMLRQLALGPRSRHQLQRKLAERDVPAPVASILLDRFEEVQLIDDAEYARMWVRSRTAAKSLSRSSLRRELADKGIDPELAEDALLQISDEDEHEQALEVVRRRLRSSADLSDRSTRDKEVRRLVGVLARKGYNPGAAFSIVKTVLAETS